MPSYRSAPVPKLDMPPDGSARPVIRPRQRYANIVQVIVAISSSCEPSGRDGDRLRSGAAWREVQALWHAAARFAKLIS